MQKIEGKNESEEVLKKNQISELTLVSNYGFIFATSHMVRMKNIFSSNQTKICLTKISIELKSFLCLICQLK